jgi:hypothetical protein
MTIVGGHTIYRRGAFPDLAAAAPALVSPLKVGTRQ